MILRSWDRIGCGVLTINRTGPYPTASDAPDRTPML